MTPTETEVIKPVRRDPEQERAYLQKEMNVDGSYGPRGEVSETKAELYHEIATVRADMAQNTTIPATIVNLTPIELHAQGPLVDDIVVEPCPPGASWSTYVIRAYKMDFPDKGGRYGVRAITPLMLAKDFVRQQRESFGRKGVFFYLGDHLPGDKEKAEMKREFDAMIADCTEKVRKAEANWGTEGGKQKVGDPERKAYNVLKAYKLWQGAEPEWVVDARKIEDVVPACPKCGVEPNREAVECRACGWLVKPAEAWKRGMVDLGNFTHKMALMQLSRQELDGLGLEALPTADEFKAQQLSDLNAQAGIEPKGKRKPQ